MARRRGSKPELESEIGSTNGGTDEGDLDINEPDDLDPGLDPGLDPDAGTSPPPAPPPAVSKFDTQLQRAALDLMPGWVGAFKDAMAKVNHRVPTDDEIAASIISGAESFREKDADWRYLHP